uniref:Uncharacterized protein n=1 Tax=Accipiter nisus TaxID=211598 RepID=A0A8B9MQ94_9AVES
MVDIHSNLFFLVTACLPHGSLTPGMNSSFQSSHQDLSRHRKTFLNHFRACCRASLSLLPAERGSVGSVSYPLLQRG